MGLINEAIKEYQRKRNDLIKRLFIDYIQANGPIPIGHYYINLYYYDVSKGDYVHTPIDDSETEVFLEKENACYTNYTSSDLYDLFNRDMKIKNLLLTWSSNAKNRQKSLGVQGLLHRAELFRSISVVCMG